jgi:hypothetical protein
MSILHALVSCGPSLAGRNTATHALWHAATSTQIFGHSLPHPLQRRLSYFAAGAGAGALAVYRNDPKQLQFDVISSAAGLVRLLDPETAHNVGIWAARAGAFPRETRPDPPSLATTVWGRTFPNPLGMAAGFDKHAEVMEPLLGLGFGFVEIGSVTPLEQPGNPQPRCFRLKEHK